MRKILIAVAIIGAFGSVAMCASYGWDQGTNLKDQITAAGVFAMVAVFSLALHVTAVRAWVHGWYKGATFLFFAGLLSFVMTAATSLGGLAARSDAFVSERQGAIDTKVDLRKQIAGLEKEREKITAPRTSKAGVDAAKLLAETSTTARKAECGNGEPKQRGKFCREKEDAEATAVKALAKAQENKAATDRADIIDTDLRALRAKFSGSTTSVGSADPLKTMLTVMFGSVAELLTAWQKAAFAVIYDIGLVAVFVGIEMLGHTSPSPTVSKDMHTKSRKEVMPESTGASIVDIEPEPMPVPSIPPPPRPRLVAASAAQPFGSVKRILSENLESAPKRKVELADLASRYRSVCREKDRKPVSPEDFAEAVDGFCREIGIGRRSIGSKIYLLDVQLTSLQIERANQ